MRFQQERSWTQDDKHNLRIKPNQEATGALVAICCAPLVHVWLGAWDWQSGGKADDAGKGGKLAGEFIFYVV